MTLRGRLLVALAYILLLAIIALEVPLAISLRDRVDSEVRSQARAQADVVAATVAGNLDDPATLDRTVKRAAETVRGRVVTREDLMARVWDENWFGSTKTLDVHVRWLRQKLGDAPESPRYLHTVRGVGFRFTAPEEFR